MSQYVFNMAADPEFCHPECLRPDTGIAVFYKGKTFGFAALAESGIVVMDLPPELVHNLSLGSAKPVARTELVRGVIRVGAEIRNRRIINFEIIDLG